MQGIGIIIEHTKNGNVSCLHISIQGENTIGHANGKCHYVIEAYTS